MTSIENQAESTPQLINKLKKTSHWIRDLSFCLCANSLIIITLNSSSSILTAITGLYCKQTLFVIFYYPSVIVLVFNQSPFHRNGPCFLGDFFEIKTSEAGQLLALLCSSHFEILFCFYKKAKLISPGNVTDRWWSRTNRGCLQCRPLNEVNVELRDCNGINFKFYELTNKRKCHLKANPKLLFSHWENFDWQNLDAVVKFNFFNILQLCRNITLLLKLTRHI